MKEVVTVLSPTSSPLPIIASIPHSSAFVPEEVSSRFVTQYREAQPNVDWHLDKLYDFLPALGVTVLKANFSRYVADVNRSSREPLYGSYKTSVVYESSTRGDPLYIQPLTRQEVQSRIETFYLPYHKTLADLLEQIRRTFGKVYLLDLHSFMGPIADDVCLGNDNGRADAQTLMPLLEESFLTCGFGVVRNKVFTGGHVVKHYAQMPQTEVLMVERYTTYLQRDELDKPVPPRGEVRELEEAKVRFRGVFEHALTSLRKNNRS